MPLTEAEFRARILESMKTLEDRQLAIGLEQAEATKRMKRIEAQTRFARNVQDVTKATEILYRVGACVLKTTLKIMTALAVAYILGYMALHEGNMPIWAHDFLKVIRRDTP